jgi:hypothetical protein
VAELAGKKVNPIVESMFKRTLEGLDPKKPLPKEVKPSELPVAGGKEALSGQDTPQPPTDSAPRTSEAPPPQEAPASPPKNAQPESSESSPSEGGTAPEPASPPATAEADKKPEGTETKTEAPTPEDPF